MGLAQVFSRASSGVEAPEVIVEIHLGGGLPKTSIVGLPETAVRESRDRVKAALLNAGFEFPQSNITISLAPADLPKEGSRFDLPIALGILAASKQITDKQFLKCEFIGELSLSGTLNPVRGILPAALQCHHSGRVLVLPTANEGEAGLVRGNQHLHAAHLMEVVAWITGREKLPGVKEPPQVNEPAVADLGDVYGQFRARRALEIAAAGGHNLLLTGSPGTGKTMLASRLPGILPLMQDSEAIEVAAIASISRAGLDISRWRQRPFRAPHHTASAIALVGGGSLPMPGEISLAHQGVLFLDELPEFSRHVLEVMREPLESGRIVIARARRRETYPARFQLVAAMNPCPCGYLGDSRGRCHCSADQINRYKGRVSGPLLDRIDLCVEMARPRGFLNRQESELPERSAFVRARVERARQRQLDLRGCVNAQLDNTALKKYCALKKGDMDLFKQASEQHALSPRACHRILKVARTLADMDAADAIETPHLAEAISYHSGNRAQNLQPVA
ncbi:MAG TPA: YifB family Mg chelatase-like AAA ATPase [Xanthomonadales bacterium]|nr:YifB family Mg chelatase-like AAA ATPase [Xanthomonadales bacterium]